MEPQLPGDPQGPPEARGHTPGSLSSRANRKDDWGRRQSPGVGPATSLLSPDCMVPGTKTASCTPFPRSRPPNAFGPHKTHRFPKPAQPDRQQNTFQRRLGHLALWTLQRQAQGTRRTHNITQIKLALPGSVGGLPLSTGAGQDSY